MNAFRVQRSSQQSDKKEFPSALRQCDFARSLVWGGIDLISNDQPVSQSDSSVGVRRQYWIMRDQHKRGAFRAVKIQQKLEHMSSVRGVKIPRRLVSKNYRWPKNKCTCQR